MATSDVHGHRVPTGSDFAARKSLTDLSLSIMGGPKSVGSLSAANLYVADVTAALAAAGLPPISADNALYVWRSDLGVIMRYDGSAWTEIVDRDVAAGIAGTNGWTLSLSFARRQGRLVSVGGFISRPANAFAVWETKPAGTVGADLRPVAPMAAPISLAPKFQMTLATDGTIGVQCGGDAAIWQAGNWGFVLQWLI